MDEGRIQPIMDLIEATLDADITAQELADQAGYSLWHFCRLFQLEVGMPLMRYRTRRRLAHALWAISQGESVTGAALRYGFDTHAGFYKAFCREYGCSPTDYLKAHPAFMPWPLQLREEQYLMLTHENWKKALAAWNLAELPLSPIVCEPTGFVADNVIYAGADWVLKAYLDPSRCARMVSLARALSAAGVAVSLPRPLPDGSDVLTFGAYRIVLWSRLMGAPLDAPRLMAGDAHAAGLRLGRTLRQLHGALDTLPDPPDVRDCHLDEHILTWAMPRAEKHLPTGFPADFADHVRRLSGLRRGLIHRDPNPNNLIDLPDGRIGVIDFDLTERNIRLFDLCYAATGMLQSCLDRDVPWQTQWPLLLEGILTGYGATLAEQKAAPTVLLGIEVICLAAFCDNPKYARLFDDNLRLLTWLCAWQA